MVERGIQGREVHAKESHKDNSLSEKAAEKIHEAGCFELHQTTFNQLIADANKKFPRIRRGVVHSQGMRREGCTKALTQLEILLRDEPKLRFKTPHTGIINNQKKSTPRETEKHPHLHLTIGGKQVLERDQKNLKEV